METGALAEAPGVSSELIGLSRKQGDLVAYPRGLTGAQGRDLLGAGRRVHDHRSQLESLREHGLAGVDMLDTSHRHQRSRYYECTAQEVDLEIGLISASAKPPSGTNAAR